MTTEYRYGHTLVSHFSGCVFCDNNLTIRWTACHSQCSPISCDRCAMAAMEWWEDILLSIVEFYHCWSLLADVKAGQLYFLSSSQDQNVHICKFDPVLAAVTVLHVCKGHAQSVDAIAVNPDGNKVSSTLYAIMCTTVLWLSFVVLVGISLWKYGRLQVCVSCHWVFKLCCYSATEEEEIEESIPKRPRLYSHKPVTKVVTGRLVQPHTSQLQK